MNNRVLLYMTGLVLVAVAVLVSMNLAAIFRPALKDRYVSRDEVKGISVIHKEKPYALNFEQQTQMISLFNESLPTNVRKGDPSKPLDFEKIVITLFHAPDMTVKPIGYDEDNGLIFSADEWESYSYIKDQSKGLLKKLITESFDH